MEICQTILDTIGNTPIVRINRLNPNPKCELLAKCEFMNPGGSVKDRIGVNMVLQAQKEGKISPGDTLIEPTSGNTGIGIALAGAVLGYHVIIVMPEKMSMEKQVVLEALGAQIVRTPTEAASEAPDSHISVAHKLAGKLPRGYMLDQYKNPDNPSAHEQYTGQEIIRQLDRKLDYLVAGVGTGGTITGVARALKAAIPGVKIVGADPVGSILGGGDFVGSYQVEGIGYDFFPEVLDNGLVDEYIKVDDNEALPTARRIIEEEGMMVGGSSGTAMAAALKLAARCANGERILVILPDSIRNYLSKFVSNLYMRQQGFTHPHHEPFACDEILAECGVKIGK